MVQIIDPELRLQRLRDLHRQIGAEITTLQERITARQAALDAQKARDQRAAADARKATAERERAERAALRDAESARIEAAAPTDLVREWARRQGIPVGDRGRIPLDLRKQYLNSTTNPGSRTTT